MPRSSIGNNSSEQVDDEPGYVHTVAPDPRRLEPLDNPVSSTYSMHPLSI